MTRLRAAALFGAFAFAYVLSALLRAVTATLAPVFSAELALDGAQLGLLAGAYFLGFALMQLPLGSALDRFGPRRVLLALLAVAAAGCMAFAAARGLTQLLLARWLIGVGVSACLMAPLTCYRRVFSAAAQLRANSWMLMSGSMGMLSATLPVHWLQPVLGWRGLFIAVALLVLAAMAVIAAVVPRDGPSGGDGRVAAPAGVNGYRLVFAHPVFRRAAPLGFVAYGGMVAMQTLWIGPWLTEVAGQTPAQAARGLFLVNLSMLVAFLAWGAWMPWLIRHGWAGERLVAWAWPPGVAVLLWIVWLGPQAGAAHWALWCVCTSVVSLSQPAVGQAFAAGLAGRALSAYNLMIFAGVFALQWGIGLGLDRLTAAGIGRAAAYRLVFAGFAALCAVAFAWLNLSRWRDLGGQAALSAGP